MPSYSPATAFIPNFEEITGQTLSGGTLEAYLAGTTTPTPMYTDNAGTSAGSSVSLNARGEPEVSGNAVMIWLNTVLTYKFVLKDSSGATLWTVDDIIPGAAGDDSGLEHVVTDIAALRALEAGVASSALVQGYYSAGDGGGGSFYWDAGSSASDDGGLVILPTGHVGAGRWRRQASSSSINVLWMGAKGDNFTDDSAKIQAAIDHIEGQQGGEVFFPAQNFVISSSLTVLSNNVVLRGVHNASYVKPDGNFHAFDVGDGVAVYSGIHFIDMRIAHTGTPTSGTGIKFQGTRNCKVDRCAIRFCFTGLVFQDTYACQVEGCRITDNLNHGINAFGNDDSSRTVDLKIEGTECHANGAIGINCGAFVTGLYVDECHCWNNTGAGFFCGGDVTDNNSDIFIRDCAFVSNGGDGARIQDANSLSIYDSRFSKNTGDGVQLSSGCENANIIGVFSGENDFHGILSAADNVLISGAIIVSNSKALTDDKDGISINSDASNNAIFSSLIYNKASVLTQRYGISDSGANTMIGQDVYLDGNVSGAINNRPNTLPVNDATPSVLGADVVHTANTSATTITDLDDGRVGQQVTIVIQDTNTTFDFSGTNLKGNLTLNHVGEVNDAVICIYDGTYWYCTVIHGTP